MKILVACEFSGRVANAFRDKGHDVWSCDLLPSLSPGQHYQGDVRDMLCYSWDIIIAHPPCTYLSKARGVVDLPRMKEAAGFFKLFLAVDCPRVAIENPMPFRAAYDYIPKPNHWVCPSHFGSQYTKFTCLWLKGLPPLMPTVYFPQDKRKSLVYCASSKQSRSITDSYLANAMAEQWG